MVIIDRNEDIGCDSPVKKETGKQLDGDVEKPYGESRALHHGALRLRVTKITMQVMAMSAVHAAWAAS
jgi:hypothetical protein